MNSRFFSIVAVMLIGIAVTTQAQEFRIGAMAGLNVSSPTNENTRLGYHVGARGEWDFRDANKGLFLNFGALLTEKGYKSNTFYDTTGQSMVWRVRPTYLEIPVHVGYRLPVGQKVSLFGSVGPYLGIGLFGKSKLTSELNGVKTTTTAANNVFDAMRRVDYGIGLRLGADFCCHYQISAAYDWGLRNTRSLPGGAPKERNRNLTVSLGYIF